MEYVLAPCLLPAPLCIAGQAVAASQSPPPDIGMMVSTTLQAEVAVAQILDIASSPSAPLQKMRSISLVVALYVDVLQGSACGWSSPPLSTGGHGEQQHQTMPSSSSGSGSQPSQQPEPWYACGQAIASASATVSTAIATQIAPVATAIATEIAPEATAIATEIAPEATAIATEIAPGFVATAIATEIAPVGMAIATEIAPVAKAMPTARRHQAKAGVGDGTYKAGIGDGTYKADDISDGTSTYDDESDEVHNWQKKRRILVDLLKDELAGQQKRPPKPPPRPPPSVPS